MTSLMEFEESDCGTEEVKTPMIMNNWNVGYYLQTNIVEEEWTLLKNEPVNEIFIPIIKPFENVNFMDISKPLSYFRRLIEIQNHLNFKDFAFFLQGQRMKLSDSLSDFCIQFSDFETGEENKGNITKDWTLSHYLENDIPETEWTLLMDAPVNKILIPVIKPFQSATFMDLSKPLSQFKRLIENQNKLSFEGYDFLLQDQFLKLSEPLADFCVQCTGQMEVCYKVNSFFKKVIIYEILKANPLTVRRESDDATPGTSKPIKFYPIGITSVFEIPIMDWDIPEENPQKPRRIYVPLETAMRSLILPFKLRSPQIKGNSFTPLAEVMSSNFYITEHKIIYGEQSLSNEPRDWNLPRYVLWLIWAVKQFDLPDLEILDWIMTGDQLCELNFDSFFELYSGPAARCFWLHIQILTKFNRTVVLREKNPHASSYNRELYLKRAHIANKNYDVVDFLFDTLSRIQFIKIIKWLPDNRVFHVMDEIKLAWFWGAKKMACTHNAGTLLRAINNACDEQKLIPITDYSFKYVYQFPTDYYNKKIKWVN